MAIDAHCIINNDTYTRIVFTVCHTSICVCVCVRERYNSEISSRFNHLNKNSSNSTIINYGMRRIFQCGHHENNNLFSLCSLKRVKMPARNEQAQFLYVMRYKSQSHLCVHTISYHTTGVHSTYLLTHTHVQYIYITYINYRKSKKKIII